MVELKVELKYSYVLSSVFLFFSKVIYFRVGVGHEQERQRERERKSQVDSTLEHEV